MAVDDWPGELPRGIVQFFPVGGGSATPALVGQGAQGASTAGPRWRARLDRLPLRTAAHIAAARALALRLEQGATPVMLRANVSGLSPQIAGGTPMEAVLGADADAGATSVTIVLAGDFRDLRGGEIFSSVHEDADVGERAYLITEILDSTDPAAPVVAIVPPLRANLSADAVLDFETPACPMRLEAGFDSPIELGRFSGVEATFGEWFGASPVVQAPGLRALTLSPSSIEEGSPEDTFVGRLFGTTAGSTLTLTDDAGGRFKYFDDAGVPKIVAGATATDYGAATSHDIEVTETLVGVSNSPRANPLTVTVTQLSGAVPHRAWRWFSYSSNLVGKTGLTSLAFKLGGSAVAGGTPLDGGSGTSGGAAALAFDGNAGTSWIRNSQTNTWVGKDWGASSAGWVVVDDAAAVVHFGDVLYGSYTASLDYTDDDPADPAAVWITQTTRTFGNTWLLGVQRLISETDPTDGSYRCLRIRVVQTWGSIVTVQTPEIQMRVGGVDILPIGHANDALIRGNADLDNADTHPAWHTWDADVSTVWLPQAFQTVGHWFGPIFPAPVKPETVWLRNQGISGDFRRAAYEGSHDNVNWTTIFNTGDIPNTYALHQIY